ncbi:hypothetical protein TrVE_jg1289 [Triparma verrucosa]|nr:hypothetical protein TrVE_jg1289 [Triparma verrucosa]
MAGSGKTTYMAQLTRHLGSECYIINLDPAVTHLPYTPSIDIRDTVDYKKVMSEYNLGPNGAIVTSLNLFSTKFDSVLKILESKTSTIKHIIIDTPGQIESFTWSASGTIITSSLSLSFPTIMTYVCDTVRCCQVSTFMSNMLYACSMMYRSRLPMVIALNKIDLQSSKIIKEWMDDYSTFMDAMECTGEESYYNSLNRSLAMTLDKFYSTLKRCSVSGATGEGVEEYLQCVDSARSEFFEGFWKDMETRRDEKIAKGEAVKKESLKRLEKDIEDDKKLKSEDGGEKGEGVKGDDDGA